MRYENWTNINCTYVIPVFNKIISNIIDMAVKVLIFREIIAIRCTMEYPSNRLTLFPFNGRKIIAKNNCTEKKTIFHAGRKKSHGRRVDV